MERSRTLFTFHVSIEDGYIAKLKYRLPRPDLPQNAESVKSVEIRIAILSDGNHRRRRRVLQLSAAPSPPQKAREEAVADGGDQNQDGLRGMREESEEICGRDERSDRN